MLDLHMHFSMRSTGGTDHIDGGSVLVPASHDGV